MSVPVLCAAGVVVLLPGVLLLDGIHTVVTYAGLVVRKVLCLCVLNVTESGCTDLAACLALCVKSC